MENSRVNSEYHMKDTNALCEQTAEYFSVKAVNMKNKEESCHVIFEDRENCSSGCCRTVPRQLDSTRAASSGRMYAATRLGRISLGTLSQKAP
jgi:hypothetical protein